MTDHRPMYMCYRPDTKSKQPHAKCRQYCFYSVPDLVAWLRRGPQDELVRVRYYASAAQDLIVGWGGTRRVLAARTDWPWPIGAPPSVDPATENSNTAHAIKIGDRFFHSFTDGGRLQTAWCIAGARLWQCGKHFDEERLAVCVLLIARGKKPQVVRVDVKEI